MSPRSHGNICLNISTVPERQTPTRVHVDTKKPWLPIVGAMVFLCRVILLTQKRIVFPSFAAARRARASRKTEMPPGSGAGVVEEYVSR